MERESFYSYSAMDTEKTTEIVTAEPFRTDDAVGVPGVKWFAAIVNARHEKSVSGKLNECGIENYVAVQKELRIWKYGKRRMIDRVVIPSVVFIRCTEKERRTIVNLPYIYRFMVNRSANSGTLNKPVAVISDAEIDKLKFMLGQSDYPVEFIPTEFKVNDNVRVIRGKLCGLEGEIRENSDGTHTLIVSLSLLGGATVFIDPHDVEKINR